MENNIINSEALDLTNGKELVLFGTGEACIDLLSKCNLNVKYFIDNAADKWGKSFYEKIIYSPEKILSEDLNNIYVIVASSYYVEISKQLRKYRMEEYVHFIDYREFYNYQIQSSLAKLTKFKNKHNRKRAFIIGNGPSLTIDDLNKLRDEITFASNKIYLAFNETSWRPTYYGILDSKVAENNADIISKLKLTKFISNSVMNFFGEHSSIYFLKLMSHSIINGKEVQGFSKDITQGIYGGYTVTYFLIQIAYFMGIRELYLIGVDFDFKISKVLNETSVHGEILLEAQGEVNHFHPNYREEGEKWTYPKLEEQYEAFSIAKRVFDSDEGCIYNASRKTKLDIFPLVNLDEILGEKE